MQQPLLIGDLLGVGWLLMVLLHLLVGQIQHTLQLVLKECGVMQQEVNQRYKDLLPLENVALFSR